jgi:hypothetical protein
MDCMGIQTVWAFTLEPRLAKMGLNLLWIFPSYRQVHDTIVRLEQDLRDLTIAKDQQKSDFLAVIGTNETQHAKVLADLEAQLARKPVMDLSTVIQELFQDIPFEDGRIPDSCWLTPGSPDVETR